MEVRTDLVLVKSLTVSGGSQQPDAFSAEVVDTPDLAWLATLPAAWRADASNMNAFRRYIDNRFGCVLVREHGEPIGYFWWTCRDGGAFGGHPHFQRLGVALADEDAWIFDLYVSPEHRRKGKPAACLRLAEAEGHRRGFRRALFCVQDSNLPARALYSRLGWKVETIEHAVVLGRRLLIGRFGIFVDAFRRRPYGFDFVPIVRWTFGRRPAISSVARAESRS